MGAKMACIVNTLLNNTHLAVMGMLKLSLNVNFMVFLLFLPFYPSALEPSMNFKNSFCSLHRLKSHFLVCFFNSVS